MELSDAIDNTIAIISNSDMIDMDKKFCINTLNRALSRIENLETQINRLEYEAALLAEY